MPRNLGLEPRRLLTDRAAGSHHRLARRLMFEALGERRRDVGNLLGLGANTLTNQPPAGQFFEAPPDEAEGKPSSASVQVTIISSSLRSPQRTTFAGSGFARLFGLLS